MLIIFDCDGVLRSVSWEGMYSAHLSISAHIDRDPADFWQDVHEFRKWHSNDWKYNLERMGVPRGSDYQPINDLFHRIYDPYIRKFPWVDEVLAHLSQTYDLAVLSGSTAGSVRESLGDSADYFSHVVGLEHVTEIKPHPEGIHRIMRSMGASASDTLIIGDSDADILAGKRAGIRTAGVVWGMTDVEDLRALDPDIIFDHPEALKDIRF